MSSFSTSDFVAALPHVLNSSRQSASYSTPYGGSVTMMNGFLPPSSRPTSSAFVESPHSTRCSPSPLLLGTSHSWPLAVPHFASNSAARSSSASGASASPPSPS